MELRDRAQRLTAAVAAAVLAGLLGAAPALLGAAPAGASQGTGWVRLAHLSPNTPPVDVYLYSFGNPNARLVLHHVSYGTVSPYEQVAAGDYTVSMRAAGAAPTARPVLSTGFWVSPRDAYTVAGMGPASGLRLQVLRDTLAVPKRDALVRVIQASLRSHVVKVTLGRQVLARKLQFARTTPYRAVVAGTSVARVAANGAGAGAALGISLRADTTHTLVVLDGAHHMRIADLEDAAGSQTQPSGGAATGLGGTAPRPAPSPLPWLAMTTAGTVLAAAGTWRYRQFRLTRTRTP